MGEYTIIYICKNITYSIYLGNNINNSQDILNIGNIYTNLNNTAPSIGTIATNESVI